MRLRKLGAALVVVAAIGAVLASSALAGRVTVDGKFFVGSGLGTELTGSESISASQEGISTLATAISGTEVELRWTGTECVECKIENLKGVATSTGKFKFTGVSVVKPATCTTSATITTAALRGQYDWMRENEVSGAAENPSTPPFNVLLEEGPLATAELSGSKCPLAKTVIKTTGTFNTQAVTPTESQVVTQQLVSSKAVSEGGGVTLKVGAEPAVLTSTVNLKMSGARAGMFFGTH